MTRTVDIRVPVPGGWEIATTVFLPDDAAGRGRVPVLLALPGGGYSRGYFDLPADGYSQARHHASQGTVVIAVDHLGAGESSVPPSEVTTLPTVAAADTAAIRAVLARLRDEFGIDVGVVVGAGQSMGGQILAAMQANHRTCDAIALLGSSVVQTVVPRRPGAEQADWVWGFHWLEELSPLAESDIAAGIPAKSQPRPWASLSVPGFAVTLLERGVVADVAAAVDVPVLLAAGERDVTCPLLTEAAAFTAARDVAVFQVERMAHMHNFAPTRARLWERLDAFVEHARLLAPAAA